MVRGRRIRALIGNRFRQDVEAFHSIIDADGGCDMRGHIPRLRLCLKKEQGILNGSVNDVYPPSLQFFTASIAIRISDGHAVQVGVVSDSS